MNISVVDRPHDQHSHTGKYTDLYRQLLELPEGKALRIELSNGVTKSAMQQGLQYVVKAESPDDYKGRVHIRRLPDGLYIWLTPAAQSQQQQSHK